MLRVNQGENSASIKVRVGDRAGADTTFFYHSFPRPREGETRQELLARGLAILRSIRPTGLILAPEVRLSSIQSVDGIYVLDGGRIVESGSYGELMRRDGVFAALSRRQLVHG